MAPTTAPRNPATAGLAVHIHPPLQPIVRAKTAPPAQPTVPPRSDFQRRFNQPAMFDLLVSSNHRVITAPRRCKSAAAALPDPLCPLMIGGMTDPHCTPIHVAFDEVDMYGIVHHSKLLVYLERARIALFVEGGINPGTLQETGFGLIVVEAELKFRAPAQFGDDLQVETRVQRISPVTVTLDYRIVRDSDIILTGTMRLAAVDQHGRPTRMPPPAKEILECFRD